MRSSDCACCLLLRGCLVVLALRHLTPTPRRLNSIRLSSRVLQFEERTRSLSLRYLSSPVVSTPLSPSSCPSLMSMRLMRMRNPMRRLSRLRSQTQSRARSTSPTPQHRSLANLIPRSLTVAPLATHTPATASDSRCLRRWSLAGPLLRPPSPSAPPSSTLSPRSPSSNPSPSVPLHLRPATSPAPHPSAMMSAVPDRTPTRARARVAHSPRVAVPRGRLRPPSDRQLRPPSLLHMLHRRKCLRVRHLGLLIAMDFAIGCRASSRVAPPPHHPLPPSPLWWQLATAGLTSTTHEHLLDRLLLLNITPSAHRATFDATLDREALTSSPVCLRLTSLLSLAASRLCRPLPTPGRVARARPLGLLSRASVSVSMRRRVRSAVAGQIGTTGMSRMAIAQRSRLCLRILRSLRTNHSSHRRRSRTRAPRRFLLVLRRTSIRRVRAPFPPTNIPPSLPHTDIPPLRLTWRRTPLWLLWITAACTLHDDFFSHLTPISLELFILFTDTFFYCRSRDLHLIAAHPTVSFAVECTTFDISMRSIWLSFYLSTLAFNLSSSALSVIVLLLVMFIGLGPLLFHLRLRPSPARVDQAFGPLYNMSLQYYSMSHAHFDVLL